VFKGKKKKKVKKYRKKQRDAEIGEEEEY